MENQKIELTQELVIQWLGEETLSVKMRELVIRNQQEEIKKLQSALQDKTK